MPFPVFTKFSLNKHWWRLRSFSPLQTSALAYLVCPSSSYRRVDCNRWRFHWGLDRELSQLISVQFFIMTFSLFRFPFLFYILLCPYLYITFCYDLVFGVCSSIYYIRNWKCLFVLCTYGTYTFAHTLRY